MHCDFLGSDRLQETHMDALTPCNSKYVTLTMRGGFFTKFPTLAHGGAWGFGPRRAEGVLGHVRACEGV